MHMLVIFAGVVLAASFLTIIGALALVTVLFLLCIFIGFLISRQRQ